MYQKLSPDIWGLIFADQLSLIMFQSYLIMVPGNYMHFVGIVGLLKYQNSVTYLSTFFFGCLCLFSRIECSCTFEFVNEIYNNIKDTLMVLCVCFFYLIILLGGGLAFHLLSKNSS